MKYEIIMKNHLNLDLIKWFCLLTFLSQVLCHSLHLSGSYQESRDPGRELRKDMDWILKINDTLCHWLSLVRKLRKEWKPSRAPGGQRRLTCAFAPPTRKSSTPPSMPLKHFHVCHFVCSSLVAFWMVEITNQSQLGIFTVDWTCLASRGFIFLFHLNPFTNDLFACGVSGFPLVLWVSHRGCKESQLAEPSLVCWQRRPCEPHKGVFTIIFHIKHDISSHYCIGFAVIVVVDELVFVADWLLLFQVSQQADPPAVQDH